MISMSFVCDYAKVSPTVLMYTVDHKLKNRAFSTYEDMDEDIFVLHVLPYEKGVILSPAECATLAETVNPYLFED